MFTYKKIENGTLIDEEKIAADLNQAIEKSRQEAKADAESELKTRMHSHSNIN